MEKESRRKPDTSKVIEVKKTIIDGKEYIVKVYSAGIPEGGSETLFERRAEIGSTYKGEGIASGTSN